MKRVIWSLLFLCIALAVTNCLADKLNGVLAEERVVNLPQDQTKWYISVVGDPKEAKHAELVKWFDTDTSLKKLKSQVHFIVTTSDTAIYKERYQPNVKGLPTIRMQKSDGLVVYEQHGTNIPLTPSGLYGAMADAAQSAQGIRPLLPWRREMERRQEQEERCKPDPTPPVDPVPPVAPPDDHIGPPTFDDPPIYTSSAFMLLPPVLLGMFLVGMFLGYGRKWMSKYNATVNLIL